MMMTLASYLAISAVLFLIGIATILARKSMVAILLGIELILNAAALNFVTYSRFGAGNDLNGHIMTLFIIVVAAAEAAVGLAIVIRYFQIKETIHIDEVSQLKE
jgi:NADH-quinone oxidoreductase subunit K